MTNDFKGLISTLYTTEKRIHQHQDGSIEITQIETQREKKGLAGGRGWGGMQNRTSKSCGAIPDCLGSVQV